VIRQNKYLLPTPYFEYIHPERRQKSGRAFSGTTASITYETNLINCTYYPYDMPIHSFLITYKLHLVSMQAHIS